MNRLAALFALVATLASALASPARADLSSRLGALAGANLERYLSPLDEGLSTTLNSGIFQTGSVAKTGLHVTFTLQVTGAEFADKDRTFTPVDPYGFSPGMPSRAPTIVGNGQAVRNADSTVVFPGGLDIAQFVLPVPQLTVGSFLGTQATVRWLSIDVNNSDVGRISFFGLGAQHSLSQYLPHLPVDVAAGAFYQTLKVGDGVLDTKAFHVDVTASRRFGAIVRVEPYASVGLDTYAMKVKYTYTGATTATATHGETIGIDFDRLTNKHLAAGAQLSFPGVKLYAEVVSAANTGAAFGLRFGL